MTKALFLERAMARVRRHLWLFISLALVLSVLAWWRWEAEPTAPVAPQTRWLSIQPQVLENQLGLVGRIQAMRQQTLAAPFGGVVREVLVHEGQRVESGQILANLDPGQLEIDLRQAQAELLKARREEQQLRDWDHGPEVSRARRLVQTARSSLSNTQANLRDTQGLFDRGIVARMEIDSLVQHVQAKRQDLLAAQEDLRITEARGQGEERKIAEMGLANAQARYDSLAEQMERQVIRAPFAGVVVYPASQESGKAVLVQPGMQVNQGASIFTVLGLDRIQVLTRVEEADLYQLQEGMPVQITGDGFSGQTLTGKVTAIGVQSNTEQARGAAYYDVTVAVDTPNLDLGRGVRLGMTAKLAVIIYRNEQGIAVPAEALRRDESGAPYVVYRATSESPLKEIKVTIGKAVLQGVEVRGLDAGEIQMPS